MGCGEGEEAEIKSAKIMLSISMAVFGTLGLFTRNIPVSSGELALYRAVLASILILVYLTVTKQQIHLKMMKGEILHKKQSFDFMRSYKVRQRRIDLWDREGCRG